jgi:site-specific recombinase XerD
VLATYLASEAKRGIRPATLSRRSAAITAIHRLAGHVCPSDSRLVRATLAGIRRTFGVAPLRRVPIGVETIRAMVATTPNTISGRRDRALLLLGFAGAFRRSELVALDVKDFQEADVGALIRIRRSKTDQEAAGSLIAIPYGSDLCAIASVKAWLAAAQINNGAVFRPLLKGGHVSNARLSDRSVADILKRYAEHAGLDPTTVSPHSLRSGLLTEAACRGASIPKLLEISRHRRIETLRQYLRPTNLFADHAAKGLL